MMKCGALSQIRQVPSGIFGSGQCMASICIGRNRANRPNASRARDFRCSSGAVDKAYSGANTCRSQSRFWNSFGLPNSEFPYGHFTLRRTRMIAKSMKAVKKASAGPGLTWVTETPTPAMGPRDVLVAVTHAGVCGTDRHIYEWDAWSASRVKLGITTGHEFVGRVHAVGSAVNRTAVGQRVSAEGHIGCGVCQPCRTGNGHICEKVDILGIDCNGCFAKYVAVPEENLLPVHPGIPDHIAAIFDPLGNAMHTAMAAGVSG